MSKDLSLRLRSARENKNLTQLQVAKLTGITNTTLSNYENATSRPDPDTLKLLAKTYNVTTDYLLGLSDVPAPVKKQEVQQQPQQPQDDFLSIINNVPLFEKMFRFVPPLSSSSIKTKKAHNRWARYRIETIIL